MGENERAPVTLDTPRSWEGTYDMHGLRMRIRDGQEPCAHRWCCRLAQVLSWRGAEWRAVCNTCLETLTSDYVERLCDPVPQEVPPGVVPPVAPARRDNVLTQAEALIYGDRAAAYGPADENMGAIISMFNAWLDVRYMGQENVTLDSYDSAIFNICQKTARLAHSLRKDVNNPHMDSIVDGAGYFGVIGKIVEERAEKRRTRGT